LNQRWLISDVAPRGYNPSEPNCFGAIYRNHKLQPRLQCITAEPTIKGGDEDVKNRWLRYVGYGLMGAVLLLVISMLFLWFKISGTPVKVTLQQADSVVATSTSPQPMRLWPGKAPGSESWTQVEREAHLGERFIRNVVDPTMTAYFPPAGTANGTAIIVCPGGGFHMLTIDGEGVNVARYLNSLGITAFVLEYRLTRTNAAFLPVMMHKITTPGLLQPVLDEMTPLILADGQQAVRIARSHAAAWGLDPNRIGMIGFSAGGYLTLNVALHHDAASGPDFVAPIYALAPASVNPGPDRIPMFLACAEDDPLVPPKPNSVRVYDTWRSAGIPVELHVFKKGGHGFGIRKQNLPSDAWPGLFHHWLAAEGYLPSPVRQ
jgi:acetyl esterase/lipase